MVFSSGTVLGSAVLKLTADASDLDTQLDRAFKTTQEKFGRISKVVGTAFLALGASITAVAAIAAKAAIAFESSFTGVRKTVEATEAQFGELAQGLRNLAKEVPVNVNELNRVAEAAGQLGIQRENILAFTETMAQLGVTTNLTAEEAATMLARFSNITGTAPEDVDRLGSALVGLGNNFATTEREIVEMALRLGGAGRISGLTAAEVFGLSAALSSVGIQAEAGGTAISQTLFEMNTAVLSGTENLEHFAAIAGVSAEEFAATFKAAPTEAVVQFVQGLRHIDDTGGDAAAALNTIGLDGARAARSIIALSGNVQGLRDAFARGNLEFEKNNALTEEAAKRFATAASKIQLAQNQLNDVAITIGGALLPPLVTLAAIVGKVVGVIGELLEANPRLTSALVIAGTAVGGLALALGGLLFVLPSLAAGFALLKGFVSRYTVTVTGATGATTAFGIASRVALGPIGLLVGALGLVAGGLAWAMRDTRIEAEKAREGLGDLDTVLFDMKKVGIQLSDVLEKRLNRALAETKQKLDDIEPAAEEVIKRLEQMTSVELEAFITDLEDELSVAVSSYKASFGEIIPKEGRARAARVLAGIAQLKEEIKLANDELRDTTASESFAASQKIAKAAIDTLIAARDGDTISIRDQVLAYGTLVDAVRTGKEAKVVLEETYEGVTAEGFKLVTVTDDITNSVISQTVALTEAGKEMYGLGEATAETTTEVTAATSAIAVQLALQEELAGITSERVRLDLLSTVARNEQADAETAYFAALQAVIDLEEAGKEVTKEHTDAVERTGRVLFAANAKLASSEEALTDLIDAEAQAAKDLAAAYQSLIDTSADLKQERADQAELDRRLTESTTEVGDAIILEEYALKRLGEAQLAHAAVENEMEEILATRPDDIEAVNALEAKRIIITKELTQAEIDAEQATTNRTEAEKRLALARQSLINHLANLKKEEDLNRRLAESDTEAGDALIIRKDALEKLAAAEKARTAAKNEADRAGKSGTKDEVSAAKANLSKTKAALKNARDAVDRANSETERIAEGHVKRLEDIGEDYRDEQDRINKARRQDTQRENKRYHDAVEQAEDGHTERLKDIQERGTEARADAVRDLGRALEKIAIDDGNRRAELEENLEQDIADRRREHYSSIEQAEADHQQRLLDIQASVGEDKEEAGLRLQRSLEDIDTDTANRRAELEENLAQDLADLQRGPGAIALHGTPTEERQRFLDAQFKLQQEFDRDLGDLEDGRQEDEAKARTRHERALTDIGTDADQDREEAELDNGEKLTSLREDWQGDQIERERKFQRDLGDLRDNRQIREAEAERRHEQTLTDIGTDAERARDEAAENRRTRLAEIEKSWHENLAGIDATFYENSEIAREEFNTALEDFETDLGVQINLLRTGWQKDYLTETRAFVGAIQAQYNSLANPMAPILPSRSGDLGQGSPGRVPVPSALPSAPSPQALVDWRLGPLPILDAGALVMGPTLAALGMNNKPELVSPVERLPELMKGAGQTSNLNINVYAETLMGENVTEIIQNQLQNARRRGFI